MRGERLPHSLIIVEEANFLADELDNPDRGSVGLCASPADIPYRPNRHQRVGSNPAYPVIRPRLRQCLGVICAFNDREIFTLPNMSILIGELALILEADRKSTRLNSSH